MSACVPFRRLKKVRIMTIEKEKQALSRKFHVVESGASVDRTETKIRENGSTLNYVTPHFRAEAEVEVSPLKEGEIYTVGWVQAVTHMKFYNEYPSGTSSWEIQELNNGLSKAVSDADGRQYPWYGVTTERVTVKGPSSEQNVRVFMNDNFSPTVSWAIPVGRDQPDTLRRVCRDQTFLVWLVVKNEITGEVHPLRAYSWRAVINIAVDCTEEVGQRSKLLGPLYQEQPRELIELSLPETALTSPRANEAQKFVWRTLDSELIFEVSCTPALSPSSSVMGMTSTSSVQAQGPTMGELRYPCRYAPY